MPICIAVISKSGQGSQPHHADESSAARFEMMEVRPKQLKGPGMGPHPGVWLTKPSQLAQRSNRSVVYARVIVR